MADDEIPAKRKSTKKKSNIPTVSEKVQDEETKVVKKKKTSSSSIKKKKSTKSKKKTSKESVNSGEVAEPEEFETTRSEINLLTATDADHEVKDEEEEEEPVKKKPEKKSRKKSERKASDPLTDSHSSLKDYFPEQALRNYLQGLHDDVESLDGDDNDYSPRYRTPSPNNFMPSFPPSQHSGKVFLEKDGGFRSTTQRKLTPKLPGNQIQPDLLKPTRTPLDLSMDSQRIFRSIGIFCHGFLAGLAFWQMMMVFILSEGSVVERINPKESNPVRTFIELYSPLSQPLHLIFYFLTVICTISILDRYDIAKFEWRQLQKLLTFKSGGFAIIVYSFSLIITLVTTRMDDKLSLFHHNSTIFDDIDDKDLEVEMTNWKVLNLCRSIAVILGWFIVSLRPNTDLLYKNLKRLSTYEDFNKSTSAAA